MLIHRIVSVIKILTVNCIKYGVWYNEFVKDYIFKGHLGR